MINVRIQIESGNIVDTYTAYKFIYLSADNRVDAPVKELESTSYPEEPGKHFYKKTVSDSFDYKVTFLVESGGSLTTVNSKIATFNSLLYSEDSTTHVKTLKKVTFYNDYKNVKIVGYAEPIAEATDFWKDKNGRSSSFAQVELTIHVENPMECDFNYTSQS